jgi:dTDP-4-dehydrorhamnose 3,5-epimerase
VASENLEHITSIAGALMQVLPSAADTRGYFRDLLRVERGSPSLLDTFRPCQVSVSRSGPGVVRGLHYSTTDEAYSFHQTVSCIEGAVIDVLVDVRIGSPTFRNCFELELSSDVGYTLFVPPGVAHGYRVQGAGSTLVYSMSRSYKESRTMRIRPDAAGSSLWQPGEDIVISPSDEEAPTIDEAEELGLLPSWN